jgi:hypothetical protein
LSQLLRLRVALLPCSTYQTKFRTI